MASFKVDFPDHFGGKFHDESGYSELTVEDLFSVLRPAAEVLVNHYKSVIRTLFKQHTGNFAESIRADETAESKSYMDYNGATITVQPYGRHKGSMRSARTRKGSSTARYAKHNRNAGSTKISNQELGYLLEVGTPRIAATHWMENANDEISDSLQEMIEEEFSKLLESKGL